MTVVLRCSHLAEYKVLAVFRCSCLGVNIKVKLFSDFLILLRAESIKCQLFFRMIFFLSVSIQVAAAFRCSHLGVSIEVAAAFRCSCLGVGNKVSAVFRWSCLGMSIKVTAVFRFSRLAESIKCQLFSDVLSVCEHQSDSCIQMFSSC